MTKVRRVVGIGSSAGGLEALSDALHSLGPDLPFAYVVAQHMSPDHESPLVDLLGRVTGLRVVPAVDGSPLEPGVIFVCPPNMDITVHDRRVCLSGPTDHPGPHPVIDMLLTSIAEDVGSDAVAVILSGSGSDGSEGSRAIHAAGGIVLAQSTGSAEFDAMPRAAVATGVVDAVIEAAELPEMLARLPDLPPSVSQPTAGAPDVAGIGLSSPGEQEADSLTAILKELRRVVGIDFTGYKAGTLTRQIERRRALTGCETLDAYADLLRQRDDEARQLCSALLVAVTGFFRDPESWAALAAELLRSWSSGSAAPQRRIWVPGCATGEEAYTVAMLASEALGSPPDLANHVKIFATDLREEDLAMGRAGRYSDSAVQAIPQPMRERWWRRSGTEWEVSPALRECIVFARHNVSVDPPFPRLDLVCVRNTLIYFQRAVQQQALGMFRFALKPGGLLFLGQSEQVSDGNHNFTILDAEHRIYKRTDTGAQDAVPVAVTYAQAPHPLTPMQQDRTHDALLAQLLPPSLVTDENDEVVDVIGDVSPWCWVSQGPPSTQVTALLRDEMRIPVRSLLLRLRHGKIEGVSTQVSTADGPVLVTATRLELDSPGFAVISFIEPGEQTTSETVAVEPSEEIKAFSQELEATQAALHATVEDLSASNEELRALNEELQASSEEAQSANEELQASNEELSTLNQELQVRTAQMQRAKTDLENVQASVSAGLVLVDKDLRITAFSPAAVRVFALIDADIGRELGSVPTTVQVPDLDAALHAAIRPGRSWMTNATGQGKDYLVQVRPYIGDDSQVQGAVVVVTDVTEVASAQREVVSTMERLGAVTDALEEVVWQRDRSGSFLLLSKGVERVFGLDRKRVIDNPGLLLAAVHDQDRDRVAVAMSGTANTWDIQYRIVHPDGTVRWVWESARPMPGPGGDKGVTTGFVRDVTERRVIEAIASRRHELLESVFTLRTVCVVLLDADAKILRANHAFVQLTGYDPAALIGMPLQAIVATADDVDATQPHVSRHRLVDKAGHPHWISLERTQLASDQSDTALLGTPQESRAHAIVAINDLTPHLEATEDLEKQVRYDIQTGVLARSEFMRRVGQESARARRTKTMCAVLWIDLDGFKEVNDTRGHSTGDLVLSQVAERIASTTRGKDNVGRLGGDEFGILVSDVDRSEGLESACERILAAVREPIHLADGDLYVTASIGIAVSPEDGTNADELVHNADTAMYSAKKHGGDHREYFQAAMNELAQAKGTRRQELSHAVRVGDFCMHYQPMIDLQTGETLAVEALIRLKRGDQIICAGEFIDDARDTGLLREIGRIGRRVLDEDLKLFRADSALADIPVSLNLSVEELEERELTKSIMDWIPPGGMGKLMIEVTEQTLLPEAGQAIDTLLLFQRLGAQICIDDFGTGYSNLGLLSRLRPTKIKIDRSLLISATADPRSRDLLQASIQMVLALEAQPVVEGVESEAQADLLKELGVTAAQGFYLARPMPPAELRDWVAQRSSQ